MLAFVLSFIPHLILSLYVLAPSLRWAHLLGLPTESWLGSFLVGWIAGAVVVAPFGCLLSSLLTERFAADPAEDRHPWSELLAGGLRRTPALYLTSLVVSVLSSLGYVLLIVPGVLLTLAWYVFLPAMVLEGRGPSASLRRSIDLTRGRRGAILGFWLTYLVAAVLAGAVIGFAFGFLGELFHVRSIVQTLATPLAEAASMAIGVAGRTAMFQELKILKEGTGPSVAAAVFD